MSAHRNGNAGGKGGEDIIPTQPAALEPLTPEVRVLARGRTESERDRAAAILLGDDGGMEILQNIRKQAINPRARTAQWAGLAAEIVGWRGTKEQVIAYIVGQLGVTVPEAREAVVTLQRTPQDPHEIYRECRAYCVWYEANVGEGE